MKEFKFKYLLLVFIPFLAGCVLSLEPFYTDNVVIQMPALNGKWQPADDQGNPENEHAWLIYDGDILTFDKGKSGLLKVTYFSINGLNFADTSVDEERGYNDYQFFHFISGHLVSRIDVKDNRLAVRPLDKDWFEEFIREHPFPGNVRSEEYTSLVTNVSSQDWVDFLEKYGADEKAFPEDRTMMFIRQN